MQHCAAILLATLALGSGAAGQLTFGPEQHLSRHVRLDAPAVVADLNGDGLPDLLSWAELSDALSWTRNLEGGSAFETVAGISAIGHPRLTDVFWDLIEPLATDFDADGDVDLVLWQTQQGPGGPVGLIECHANLDGRGRFGIAQIFEFPDHELRVFAAADMNGDGLDDLLVSLRDTGASPSPHRPAWLPATGALAPFAEPVVLGAPALENASVMPADLDGDGSPDLIATPLFGGEPSWVANLDGMTSFGAPQPLALDAHTPRTSIDVDGDGDLDLVGLRDDLASWFENTDGLGSFGPARSIHASGSADTRIVDLVLADVDADGDPDAALLLAGPEARLDLTRNTDGAGTFGAPVTLQQESSDHQVSAFASGVFARDMDADGDLDLLAGLFPTSLWFPNEAGEFVDVRVLSVRARPGDRVTATDLDQDGDLDVVLLQNMSGGVAQRLAWYAQSGGPTRFSELATVPSPAEAVASAVVPDFAPIADVTGDGVDDLVLQLALPPQVEPTTAGALVVTVSFDAQLGAFETIAETTLTTSAGVVHPVQLLVADLDADAVDDIVALDQVTRSLSWHRGEPRGSYALGEVLVADATISLYQADDIDLDGDLDLAFWTSGNVSWYENLGVGSGFDPIGKVLFSSPDVLLASLLPPVDIDADGDRDLLIRTVATGGGPHGLTLLEKRASASFATHVLTDASANVHAADVADLDGDGIADVVFSYRDTQAAAYAVGWLQGLGAAQFAELQTLDVQRNVWNRIWSIDVADLDGDGSQDLLLSCDNTGAVWWLAQGALDASFVDLGGALAGSSGSAQLSARGTMKPEQRVTLVLEHAPPSSPFFLVVGSGVEASAFLDGVLLPRPDVVVPRITDAAGRFEATLRVPPDFDLLSMTVAQAWVVDPFAEFGFAASNALAATVLSD